MDELLEDLVTHAVPPRGKKKNKKGKKAEVVGDQVDFLNSKVDEELAIYYFLIARVFSSVFAERD